MELDIEVATGVKFYLFRMVFLVFAVYEFLVIEAWA